MTGSTIKGRLIGYARVSTEDQATDAQVDVLKAAGCVEIFREHMSGAKATRPELAKAMSRVRRGDVLVVARTRPAGALLVAPSFGNRRP